MLGFLVYLYDISLSHFSRGALVAEVLNDDFFLPDELPLYAYCSRADSLKWLLVFDEHRCKKNKKIYNRL